MLHREFLREALVHVDRVLDTNSAESRLDQIFHGQHVSSVGKRQENAVGSVLLDRALQPLATSTPVLGRDRLSRNGDNRVIQVRPLRQFLDELESEGSFPKHDGSLADNAAPHHRVRRLADR